MTHRSPLTTALMALLLSAPLSIASAQEQAADALPAIASEAGATAASPAPATSPSGHHRFCPKHKGQSHGQKTGHHGGKRCSGKHGGKKHAKHQQVLDRLDRIEQRQILIETMLRQLLDRN